MQSQHLKMNHSTWPSNIFQTAVLSQTLKCEGGQEVNSVFKVNPCCSP